MIRTFRQNGNLYALFEQFDHISEDEKTLTTFRVTEMLIAMAEGKLPYEKVISPIDINFARKWLPLRELNLEYVESISPTRLAEPVLGANMPDGTTLLIDGSHRYAACYVRHIPFIQWDIIKHPDWLPFATVKENKS
jgi:hypothetical protein